MSLIFSLDFLTPISITVIHPAFCTRSRAIMNTSPMLVRYQSPSILSLEMVLKTHSYHQFQSKSIRILKVQVGKAETLNTARQLREVALAEVLHV